MEFDNNSTIIKKPNNYFLQRKLLTIHANDRDTKYYQYSNEFEIKCPESYTNIQSLKVNEISFPSKPFNFSKYLNNTSFSIEINGNLPHNIIIPDGFYNEKQMANTIENLIRRKCDISFIVSYIEPANKFIFISDNSFILMGNDVYECNNNNFINQYPKNTNPKKTCYKFDFLYHLGFDLDKTDKINSKFNTAKEILYEYKYYLDLSYCPYPGSYNYMKISGTHRFLNTQPIYMELKKWSVYDELNPFPINSSNLYNNYNNGSINTAVLKIPPKNTELYSEAFDENNAILFFDPPLERISNFGFKFRYHDGRLIDIEKQDINFTLEINQLRTEIYKKLMINTNTSLS